MRYPLSYLFLFYAYECFCYMFVWSPSVCLVQWKVEESIRSPRFGGWRYSCELQCSLCLTVALSLWPHHFLLKMTSILLIFLLNINVFIFGGLELESFVFGLWESFEGVVVWIWGYSDF